MKILKVLNSYCGIGGNRKLWDNIKGIKLEITAVEYKQEIADIYHDFFPNDKIVVADAHQYLLDHFKEFDFIWSSPPCPTHSKARYAMAKSENETFKEKYNQKPIYPDMKLYKEILFLRGYFKGKYCVENVVAWYKPLIVPQEIESHWWWSNFVIQPYKSGKNREHNSCVKVLEKRKGFNLNGYNKIDKALLLRNCVEPEIGKHILTCALGLQRQKPLL